MSETRPDEVLSELKDCLEPAELRAQAEAFVKQLARQLFDARLNCVTFAGTEAAKQHERTVSVLQSGLVQLKGWVAAHVPEAPAE